MEKINYNNILKVLNTANVWIQKPIKLIISEEQYKALHIGYSPNWEMRYSIFFNKSDNYFYAYRSGFITGKYRFQVQVDNSYYCSEMYMNPDKPDFLMIFDILIEACNHNKVELNLNQLLKMKSETDTSPIGLG